MARKRPSCEGSLSEKTTLKGGTLIWPEKGPPMKGAYKRKRRGKGGPDLARSRGKLIRENDAERGDPNLARKGASYEGRYDRKRPGKGGP